MAEFFVGRCKHRNYVHITQITFDPNPRACSSDRFRFLAKQSTDRNLPFIRALVEHKPSQNVCVRGLTGELKISRNHVPFPSHFEHEVSKT